MAGRRMNVVDIHEVVRRLRADETVRSIARELGISRNTVRDIREVADEEGWLAATDLPDVGAMEARLKERATTTFVGPPSTVEPFRAFVVEKLQKNVEVRALFQLLRERGYAGSYGSVLRFVRKLQRREPDAFVRVETDPGDEAQVDFGYAGMFLDPTTGKLRKGWVFVMTLSFSRHMYAEIVFDQKVDTWIALHIRAFEWFGGVPRRVVLDNLKAAIVDAVLHDQEAQRSYREFAEHYGFLISPCRPATPRHKGKVESAVHYVKRNGLAGRSFVDVVAANAHLRTWVLGTAGVRDHGTTHQAPLARFEVERPALLPLAPTRYEVAVYKVATVHSDCHVFFDYSYYSVPYRLVGEEVLLRVTATRVEVHEGFTRIATHSRAAERGRWVTRPEHMPPEKLETLLARPDKVREEAKTIGPSTSELIERLLGERPMDRLAGAQGVLRLAKKHGAKRVEAACRRALAYDDVRYQTIKNILANGLDVDPVVKHEAAPVPQPKAAAFARSISEFVSFNPN